MSAHVASLYQALAELVRKAARYLRIGDNVRSHETMVELEELAEGVGLDNQDVQFPVGELMGTDLVTKLPGMVEGEVLRYVTEAPDEDNCTDIHLEIWHLSRDRQVKVGYVGQLFRVRIQWGLFSVCINVIAARDEYVTGDKSLATVETGGGLAYLVDQFSWGTFRIFAREEGTEVSAGKRLLYMTVLDRVYFDFVDIDQFSQWSSGMVLDQMEAHSSSMRYPRFSAAEAGLVVYERNYEEEELLQATPSKDQEKEGGVSATTREEEGIHSPGVHLMSKKINDSGNDEDEAKRRTEASNNNADDEEKHTFNAKNAAGEKVVLTATQMKKVLNLLIEEISPEKTPGEVREMVNQVDLGEITRKTNAGLRNLRGRTGEHEDQEEAIEAEEGGAEEEDTGHEMWSSDEEEEPDQGWLELSGISSLPNLSTSADSARSAELTPEEWSPVRRLRSLNCSMEPAAKRARTLNVSEDSESSIPLRHSILLSPMLAKKEDGREVVDVSTASSSAISAAASSSPPSAELSPDSIARGGYLKMFLENQNKKLNSMNLRQAAYIDDLAGDALMTEDITDITDIVGEFSYPY